MGAAPPLNETAARARRRALQITLGYVVCAGAWIAGGDWLLFRALPDVRTSWLIGSLKGFVFIAVTAAILYYLLRRIAGRSESVESRLELLARRSQDMIFRLRLAPDRAYEYVSPAAEVLTGYTAEDHYRDPDLALKLVHPDDRHELFRQVEDPESMGLTEELRWVRRDGETVWIELKSSLVRDSEGRPVALEGIVRDVTERREAERERRVLAAALEATSDSVVITDAEGRIEYVNPAFSRISGWSREDVMGQNPRLLKSGVQDEAFYRRMWRTLTRGRTFRGRFVNRRADGTLYTQEATITPVRGASSRVEHYVDVARDVTERDLLEHRLQEAQRFEDMAQITGGVSHDFRNVLGVIRGQVEKAQEAETEGRYPADELGEISRAVERGVDLVGKLLTLGRSEGLERHPLSLAKVVKELYSVLRTVLSDTTTLDVRLPDDDPLSVLGDRGSLEQILLNLATNARDALPEGGRVMVELDRTRELAADAADLVLGERSVPLGGWARLRFEDDGEGMTEDTLRRIFEPFFTTKPRDRGTGIGMSMVARLVKLHGGTVTVSSRPGAGTRISLLLPISLEDVIDDPRGATEPLAHVWGAGQRILVVEDEEHLLETQVRALKRLGYRPEAAKDGAEAIRILEDHGEEIDLVLTDLIMPNLGGKELYDAMGALGLRDIPVVFMSGYTLADVIGALPAGARSPLLEKPWTIQQLGLAVSDGLKAARPAPEAG